MWNYDRKLQYPVNIKNPDAKAAKIIISQYGGLNLNKILYKNLNDRYGNQIYKMKKARRLKLVGKLLFIYSSSSSTTSSKYSIGTPNA